MTVLKEQKVELIIQNMEIMITNAVSPKQSEALLQAFHDARFFLDIQLLRIFQASLKTLHSKEITDTVLIRDSILTALNQESNEINNTPSLRALRMARAEELMASMLSFAPIPPEQNQSTPQL